MAVIHYSSLVTGIKGRTRGAIFQSGPGGQIVRSAGSFNRTVSTRWQQMRHQTSVLAQTWNTLTEAQIFAWNSMALNFPTKNRFGEKRLTSGYNLFMSCNKRVLALGSPMITDPTMPVALTNLDSINFINFVPSSLLVLWSVATGPNELFVFFATAPMRPNRRVPPGGFKFITAVSAMIGGTSNLAPSYNSVFGAAIVGTQIIFRCFVYNTVTGQKSPFVLAPGVVF